MLLPERDNNNKNADERDDNWCLRIEEVKQQQHPQKES